MRLRSALVLLPICASVALVAGCNFNSYIYRPDVHQGNLVTKEMADQLQIGMSRAQVQFLMGEPLIKSQLHENRWDYLYYSNPRRGDIVKRPVTLWFDEQGLLTKIDHGELPTELQADSMILKLPTDFKTETGNSESAKAEPANTEPASTEPASTEPANTEPANTEPTNTEPAIAEPAKE
jgi:outer membrane protein assembly factor BamE